MSQIEEKMESFYTRIINELDELFRREMVARPFVEVKELLESKSFDDNIFLHHLDLLCNFLELLEDYKKTKDKKIINVLEDKAVELIRIADDYSLKNQKIYNWGERIFEQYKKLEKFNLDIKNQQFEISNLNLDIEKEANKIIDELKTKNHAYSQLIDENSNARILKLYTGIYDDEIEIANKYRNWALGIFAAIGIILILGFLNISIQNWNHLRDGSYIYIPLGWESLVKTLMLFSLTTPAWYLARESSKHRKVAYKAKMLGTELASFPLYAREFKDEDRLELRKHLADRFFGQELYNDHKNSTINDNSLEQMKFMTETNKVLAEALKAKKVLENP